MDSIQTTLFFNGFRHYIGKKVHLAVNDSCRRFLREHDKPLMCCFCGDKVTHKFRSVDHIIPKSIAYELELPNLFFDHRNMRVAHIVCNSKRANKTHDLPEAVLAKLDELRAREYA